MRNSVQLRADVTQISDDEFLVVLWLVRGRAHVGALGVELVAPATMRPLGDRITEFDDFAGANQPRGLHHPLRRHEIGSAALIGSAPLRWTPLRVGRRAPGLLRGRGNDHSDNNGAKNLD